MTTYTKTTDFLAKDSLPLNNAGKYVKGSEIDTEFNNIATADADNLKISALGAGIETALGVNTGSAGAPVLFNGAGGTPSSITLTNASGTAASLTAGTASAVAVGGITGLGTGVATALAVNVGSAGAPVVNGGALGTPASGDLSNCTGITNTIVQIVEATPVATVVTCNTVVPLDDTIPQNTEGNEVITVAITPTNASNRLRIEFSCWAGLSASDNYNVALFQDATANALTAASNFSAGNREMFSLAYEMAAGTTSATTFKIRLGPSGGGTAYVNGSTAGAREFGGVSAARLCVTEIKV